MNTNHFKMADVTWGPNNTQKHLSRTNLWLQVKITRQNTMPHVPSVIHWLSTDRLLSTIFCFRPKKLLDFKAIFWKTSIIHLCAMSSMTIVMSFHDVLSNPGITVPVHQHQQPTKSLNKTSNDIKGCHDDGKTQPNGWWWCRGWRGKPQRVSHHCCSVRFFVCHFKLSSSVKDTIID